MIEQYTAGEIKIDGRTYRKDVKIVNGQVREGWWRKEGHRVYEGDIADILSSSPEVLVIGTGYGGNMHVARSLISALEDKHIRLISEDTKKATEIFNDLASEGEDVAGAFHLTC